LAPSVDLIRRRILSVTHGCGPGSDAAACMAAKQPVNEGSGINAESRLYDAERAFKRREFRNSPIEKEQYRGWDRERKYDGGADAKYRQRRVRRCPVVSRQRGEFAHDRGDVDREDRADQ